MTLTKTQRDVARYRDERIIPERVTALFLAMLRPHELRVLATKFFLWSKNGTLKIDAKSRGIVANMRRRHRDRYNRVQRERRRRGLIK